jgi:hypothetical protein
MSATVAADPILMPKATRQIVTKMRITDEFLCVTVIAAPLVEKLSNLHELISNIAYPCRLPSSNHYEAVVTAHFHVMVRADIIEPLAKTKEAIWPAHSTTYA